MQTNKSTTHLQRATIRFRRYSRKAYAVFASLNCNITIGKIASYIADAEMTKTMASKLHYCNDENTLSSTQENEQNEFESPTTFILNTIILPVQAAPSIPAAALAYTCNNYKEN